MKQRMLSFFLMIAFIVSSFGTVAFAQNSQSFSTKSLTTTTTEMSTTPGQMTDNEAKTIANAGTPDVTIDQASKYFERKGFELVGLLQTIVQPFAVIIFIGCALMALVGAFGNGSLTGKGITGMVIAVILYAVVLYAPELMDFFLTWVGE